MKSSPLARQLGARLRVLRAERHLTQAQLAERAGLDPAELSRYERGERTPGLENFARIAKALGVSLSALNQPSEDDAALDALVAELQALPVERRRALVMATRSLMRDSG